MQLLLFWSFRLKDLSSCELCIIIWHGVAVVFYCCYEIHSIRTRYFEQQTIDCVFCYIAKASDENLAEKNEIL